MSSKVASDLYVQGTLKADTMVVPADSVGDAAFNVNSPLTAAKQQHQHVVTHSQAHGTAAVAQRKPIHIAFGDGAVYAVWVAAVVACTSTATITFTLLKNGVNILSSTLQLTSATAAFVKVTGTIGAGGTYVDGDVFESQIAVAAGAGVIGQAPTMTVVFRENAEG